MHVYRFIHGTYTVGFYSPASEWEPIRDFDSAEEAECFTRYMNGGSTGPAFGKAPATAPVTSLRDALLGPPVPPTMTELAQKYAAVGLLFSMFGTIIAAAVCGCVWLVRLTFGL